ncbi:hypothetical protein JD844_013094 [Phrynosoma platyrhinos]|uniref:ATP-grasp fold succinyl-CoA synthetase-type domain-containing protein n=1 Tax=Phrynosoma platyrhinos TaxID=52577 RepID=A0ABQ7TM81_PHRPL|nr:hypothetical protein JD844_013094 [Phrynosoma platyrhinos]
MLASDILAVPASLDFTSPAGRESLGIHKSSIFKAADQIKKLYNLFLKIDATQVEVNPFGETPEGQVVCFDAKINFDDNAEFRQKEIFAMDDKSENEPIENEAALYDLKYIGLDGNIACFGQKSS